MEYELSEITTMEYGIPTGEDDWNMNLLLEYEWNIMGI
jgi:hypothetical protein